MKKNTNKKESNMQEKTLNVTSNNDLKNKVSDVQVVGKDLWTVLCKASSKSQGWMKSTKAMGVPCGCLVQVTTQQGDNVSEALTFVDGVKIQKLDGGGAELVMIYP